VNAHGPTGDVGPKLSYVAALDPDDVFAADVFAADVFADDVFADDVFADDVFADDVFAVVGRVVVDAIVVGGFDGVDGELTAGVVDEPPTDEAEPPARESVEFVALHPPRTRAAATIHGAREPALGMSDDT
jgi:hypothetical protein